MSLGAKLATGLAVVALLTAALAVGLTELRLPSQPEALALVQGAADALPTVALRGVVLTTVRTPDGPVQMRAEVHRGDGRVQLKYLDGPAKGMQVFRQGDLVWSTGEMGHTRRIAGLAEGELRPDLLDRNYRFRIIGHATVAGRPVTQVRGVGPAGSLLIAVDDETGFPLMLERRSREGEVMTSTVYQTANLAVDPPAPVEPPAEARRDRGPEGGRPVGVAQMGAEGRFTPLQPRYLPTGFQLQGSFLHETPRGPLGELRYTDGLRTFSVLERSASNEDATRSRGEDRQGRGRGSMMHFRGAGGGGIRRTIQGTTAVVVGGVAEPEMARVADSLQPVQGSGG